MNDEPSLKQDTLKKLVSDLSRGPDVFIDKPRGMVSINIRSDATGEVKNTYDIPLDKIPDATAALRWINQLLEKSWITTRLLRQFIAAVGDAKGFKIYPDAPKDRD